MKKIWVGFILFFIIPLAHAQEVEIFGQSYSIILVIPLLLILLLLAVFAGMVVFDTIRRRKKLRQQAAAEEAEESKPIKEESTGKIHEKKALPKKKEIRENRQAMILRYLREIKNLEKALPGMDAERSFEALSTLIRRFFSEFFDIGYRFTYEELEKELKKTQQEVVFFAESLSKLHYGPIRFTKAEVQDLFYEFREVVDTLVKGEQVKGDERIKSNLKIVRPFLKLMDLRITDKKIEQKQEMLPKAPAQARTSPAKPKELMELEKRRLQTMHELIRYGQELAVGDVRMANEVYRKLYDHYQNLPEIEKRDIYPSVIELYKIIKSRL